MVKDEERMKGIYAALDMAEGGIDCGEVSDRDGMTDKGTRRPSDDADYVIRFRLEIESDGH